MRSKLKKFYKVLTNNNKQMYDNTYIIELSPFFLLVLLDFEFTSYLAVLSLKLVVCLPSRVR